MNKNRSYSPKEIIASNPYRWENPYGREIEIRVTRVDLGNYKLINGTYKKSYVELESDKKLRIYLTKGTRDVMRNMSQQSSKMLLWIISNMKYGSEMIYLGREDYKLKNLIKSDDTFFKARKELIDIDIMRKSPMVDIYFVNPQFMFFGDRKDKFETRKFDPAEKANPSE